MILSSSELKYKAEIVVGLTEKKEIVKVFTTDNLQFNYGNNLSTEITILKFEIRIDEIRM